MFVREQQTNDTGTHISDNTQTPITPQLHFQSTSFPLVSAEMERCTSSSSVFTNNRADTGVGQRLRTPPRAA